MSLTDPQFIAWLKTTATGVGKLCVLVEVIASVSGVETTRYLSNSGYTTGPTDTPANQHYTGCISGGATITEKLAIDNSGAGMSFGDVELDNTDGSLDVWLADVWANRSLKMYVGDMSWARTDFRLVFDGITANLDSQNRDVLNLKVRDKLQRLNTAVTATTLGGTSANKDRLLPLVFGEVHNIEPLLIDKATLKYQIHNGQMERDIEVRDNGVVVTQTDTLSAGTFVLTATPACTVTCSAQGAWLSGTYVNTVSKIVQLLVQNYGTNVFVSGDLDASNLSTFDAANAQPVGIYLTDRENVLSVCQQLAASVGAQVVMSAGGLLRLIKIALPATGTPTAVTYATMREKSLRILPNRPDVVAGSKLGFCKNWTVQNNLQTGIPPEHKDLYGQEWLTRTATDSAVATAYKLTQAPDEVDTLLLVGTDADAENTRRLSLWKVQRTVFAYDGEPELMLEELGGYQTLTHARFGLSAGVSGQIITVVRDWLNAKVSFEVLV
jgi:hypothetical protein